MRVVIAMFVLGGCASESTCLLEDVIADRVGQQQLVSCDLGDLQLSRECALAANQDMRPFEITNSEYAFFSPGGAGESTMDYGSVRIVGLFESSEWKVYLFEFVGVVHILPYEGGTETQARTSTSLCSPLVSNAPCLGTACLSCGSSVAVDVCIKD